jgi:hypothetical protein
MSNVSGLSIAKAGAAKAEVAMMVEAIFFIKLSFQKYKLVCFINDTSLIICRLLLQARDKLYSNSIYNSN